MLFHDSQFDQEAKVGHSVESVNVGLLNSVKRYGLRPLDKIPKSALHPCSVLNVHGLSGNICVQYCDLESADEKQIADAITVMVYEEYTGLLGIFLERAWPLQSIKHAVVRKAEIQARLRSGVVFVLRPPSGIALSYQFGAQGHPTTLRSYCGLTEDGFSQTRGRCLGYENPSTSRVTEIKTTYQFSNEEILHILVPEPLLDTARSAFGSDKRIVPVRMKSFELIKIPKILKLLFNEEINPITVAVPDYESVLLQLAKSQQQSLVVHGIRLKTEFDYMYRLAADKQMEKLLATTGAVRVDEAFAGHGVYWIDKQFGVSKDSLIQNAMQQFALVPEQQRREARQGELRKANQKYQVIFALLKTAMAGYAMNVFYGKLNKAQEAELTKQPNIYTRQHPAGHLVIIYPLKMRSILDIIISPRKLSAALKIAHFTRGQLIRRRYLATVSLFRVAGEDEKQARTDIVEARETVELAKQQVAQAETSLSRAKESTEAANRMRDRLLTYRP